MAKPMSDEEKNPEKYFNSPVGHVRDRIVIHPNADVPKEGIFLSLNGFSFLAKAGVEIDLPRPVRKMLDTRIKTETLQDENGKEYTRDIPRYTYTLVKEGVNLENDANGLGFVPASTADSTPA